MPALPVWNATPVRAVGVAVLLAVAFWAGDVRAGCGDHVVILSADKTTGSDEASRPPSPAPCRGPNCTLRQTPPAPLPPAPLAPKPLPPDALLTDASDADLSHAQVRTRSVDHLPAAGHPADIFHPPRLG